MDTDSELLERSLSFSFPSRVAQLKPAPGLPKSIRRSYYPVADPDTAKEGNDVKPQNELPHPLEGWDLR